MRTAKTEAILLRAVDVGEWDRIIHLLTPDLEELFGFFEAVGFIHPTLEEEEPVTNRANDEEWPQ